MQESSSVLYVDQLVADVSRVTLELEEATMRARAAEETSERLRDENAALQKLCASIELDRDTLQRKFLLATEEIGALVLVLVLIRHPSAR